MKLNDGRVALDYDDVLLVPSSDYFLPPKDSPKNRFSSRTQADPTTRWTYVTRDLDGRECKSNPFIPVFPANMTSIVTPMFANVCLQLGFPIVFPRIDQIQKMGLLPQLEHYLNIWKSNALPPMFYSVGVTADSIREFDEFYQKQILSNFEGWNAGICVDVSNGHTPQFLECVRELAKKYPRSPIMAGNFIVPEVAAQLANAGCDIIKVSIGSGSVCTTRLETGVGYPMTSLISRIDKFLWEYASMEGRSIANTFVVCFHSHGTALWSKAEMGTCGPSISSVEIGCRMA
jgi:hypothetical protein